MGRRKKKRHGHYCWSCDRYKANERFSGKGHARHLCRECAKLGGAELTYRQDLRNIDRSLNDDGTVRRKHRRFVERFLGHSDLRLRAWADQLLSRVVYFDELDDLEMAELLALDDGLDQDCPAEVLEFFHSDVADDTMLDNCNARAPKPCLFS